MRYPYLLFDADNTLFDFDKTQALALENTMLELHGSFDPSYLELYDGINHRFWAAFERGDISQAEIKEKRFAAFLEALELDLDPAEMNRRYLQALAQGHYLLDGALELVQWLVERHTLLIVTNGLKEVQRPRFSASPIISYFKDIVVSDELGVAKPKPGIFDEAFRLLGQPDKNDVLMIGDSLGSDMQGGCDYGIDTCWFNPAAKPNQLSLAITYEAKSYEDLRQILL